MDARALRRVPRHAAPQALNPRATSPLFNQFINQFIKRNRP